MDISPGCLTRFIEEFLARNTLEQAENDLFGTDVCESYATYCRAREFLQARRPGLMETDPALFYRLLADMVHGSGEEGE